MTTATAFLLAFLLPEAQTPEEPSAAKPVEAGAVPREPRTESPDRRLRIDDNSLRWIGSVRGWTLGSSTALGDSSSTQIQSNLRAGTLPIFRDEWAWTGVASKTVGRSTVTFAGGVAHYETPPPLLSRSLDGASPLTRAVAPLSQGHPATILEASVRIDHRLMGKGRQLRVFGEAVISSPIGVVTEIELPDGATARPASTGHLAKGGAIFSF